MKDTPRKISEHVSASEMKEFYNNFKFDKKEESKM